MATKEEYKKRIINALEGPYKEGIITKELMKKVQVNIEDKTEVRKFYKAKKHLKKKEIVENIQIGRKKINYLPKNKKLVIKKWDLKEKSIETDITLDYRREHSKDLQDKVIKPLFNFFKRVNYGWELSLIDENEKMYSNKLGIPYYEVSWSGEKGMHIFMYEIVKSPILLDDYLKNHAPNLKISIKEFKDKYNEFWKKYFEFHGTIRNIISEKMKLPITCYDPSINLKNKEKNSSVTTNLQYKFADLVLYGNIFDEKYYSSKFCIEEQDDVFEFWSSNEIPKKCYIRINKKGYTKKEINKIITEKIELILKDIKTSKKLKDSSDQIQKLRNLLQEMQYIILIHLEKDLYKQAIDGACEFYKISDNSEKNQNKQEFRWDIFHKYLHDKS